MNKFNKLLVESYYKSLKEERTPPPKRPWRPPFNNGFNFPSQIFQSPGFNNGYPNVGTNPNTPMDIPSSTSDDTDIIPPTPPQGTAPQQPTSIPPAGPRPPYTNTGQNPNAPGWNPGTIQNPNQNSPHYVWQFVPSNPNFPNEGGWQQLMLQYDPRTGSYRYIVNGVMLYNQPPSGAFIWNGKLNIFHKWNSDWNSWYLNTTAPTDINTIPVYGRPNFARPRGSRPNPPSDEGTYVD